MIITVNAALVDVFAPTPNLSFGDRVILTTAAPLTVLAPTPRVIMGQPGSTLADLDLSPPNVVITQTYEVVISGEETGVMDAVIPAIAIEALKRRYETQRPIFGYSQIGVVPAERESGVYYSEDSGDSWRWLSLPEFGAETIIQTLAAAEKDGTSYLFFAGLEGHLERHTLPSGARLPAVFEGPAPDLDLGRAGVDIAVAPSTSQIILLAGGISAGIWRSTNLGETFRLANAGQGSSLGGNAVAFHPTVAGLCYCGGYASGTTGAPLYRSTDSGATWTLVNTLAPMQGRIHNIGLSTDTNAVYLRTQSGMLKSTNQGSSFTTVQTGLPDPEDVAGLAVSLVDPLLLYVAVLNTTINKYQVYKSTNGAANWTLVLTLNEMESALLRARAIACHPTDADIVAIATEGQQLQSGIYYSDTAGTSWVLRGLPDGIVDPTYLSDVTFLPAIMAAVGRRKPPISVRPQLTVIGHETLYGEIHEATIRLPYATDVLVGIEERIDRSGETPIYPRVRINTVFTWRSGALEKRQLCEVRLTRIDVTNSATENVLTIFGRLIHDEVSHGRTANRILPRNEIASIEESETDHSITLPGCVTEWQIYDEPVVDGQPFRVSAIRYNLTNERRVTVLGVSIVASTTLDPALENATQHPQVTIGRSPAARIASVVPRQSVLPRRS